MNLKKCYGCCKNKPLSAFDKDKQKNDGYRGECKECRYSTKIPIPDGFRRCTGKTGCGEIKPVCEFVWRKDINKYDGRCMACKKLYLRGYRSGNANLYIKNDIVENLDDYLFIEKGTHKRCLGCKKTKPLDGFNKQRLGRLGVRSQCKECRSISGKKWLAENPRTKKTKSINNNGYLGRKYNSKEEYVLNKKIQLKIWKQKHQEEVRKYDREYASKRYANDMQFRLIIAIRNRVNKSLHYNIKPASIIKSLGCSRYNLKAYLESKFYPNKETGEVMTWDNYGFYGWHIDHIRPLASFDLTDTEQFKAACHYTNLQPLWAKDNLKKGAKYES